MNTLGTFLWVHTEASILRHPLRHHGLSRAIFLNNVQKTLKCSRVEPRGINYTKEDLPEDTELTRELRNS